MCILLVFFWILLSTGYSYFYNLSGVFFPLLLLIVNGATYAQPEY